MTTAPFFVIRLKALLNADLTPTVTKTKSTPRPPVSARISAAASGPAITPSVAPNARAAASFSGLVDCDTRADWSDPENPVAAAFGLREGFLGSDADLFALASAADPAAFGPLTLDCGDGDFLFEGNRRFAAHAEGLGLPVTATWHPGRAHTWGYWDERVAAFLAGG